jgi:alpha-galactosidase
MKHHTRILTLACAALALTVSSPLVVAASSESPILTPKPSPKPRINGAKVFGVRPGHPILYTIAATGERPMKFSAAGLPDGARLDEQKGRISGSVANRGTYRVMLRGLCRARTASGCWR